MFIKRRRCSYILLLFSFYLQQILVCNMASGWKKILPYIKNKYIMSVTFFIAWVLFFDTNNLIDRISLMGEIRRLERNREYYIERIHKDSARMQELKTDRENLEKFAREQYLMKKDDEDIFVIIYED